MLQCFYMKKKHKRGSVGRTTRTILTKAMFLEFAEPLANIISAVVS